MAIQAYLTAAVINLKRLAALLTLFLQKRMLQKVRSAALNPVWSTIFRSYQAELRLARQAA